METEETRISLGDDPREWEDEEIITLSEGEISRWVDIEGAFAGVDLLPPEPGRKPEIELPDPDTTIYVITFGWRFTWEFRTEESARAIYDVLDSVSGRVTTEASGDRSYIVEEAESGQPRLSPKKVYSAELWGSVEKAHEAYSEELASWQERRTLYDRIANERAAIEQELRDAIVAARSRLSAIARAGESLKRYLDLADGVREIALVFMYSAQPDLVRVLGLEAEAHAARNPNLDQKHARVLRYRVGQIRRLVESEEEEPETEEVKEEDGVSDF
jgi:hypothetical protein